MKPYLLLLILGMVVTLAGALLFVQNNGGFARVVLWSGMLIELFAVVQIVRQLLRMKHAQ